MKNIISSVIFVITIIVSSAQAQVTNGSSNHLEFKSVPIDGTLREYALQMQKKGFTQISSEDGVSILIGDFAGYKNCTVGVSSLKQKDLVNKIVVIFPDQDTWSALASNYFSLQEMLTEKYGRPSDYVEKFQGYSQPKNDNDKMYEVKFDRCTYYTIYETEKGSIELSIEHDGVSSCYVRLAYFDKINGEIIRKKALDDL